MLNVFDLAARITLDSGDFELSLESVTRQMKNFLNDSVKTGMSFDKAMSQVAATRGYTVKQLNATEEDLAAMSDEEREAALKAQKDFTDLRAFAQEMGRTTVFTASQAAEALNYMALAGYDAETSMKTLPAVLNLAAAGDLQLGYASDVVTDAQTALGLSTEQTFDLVEQMAKTASTTNTSVGQLAEAILTIGGTARFIKGGTQELNAVLGVLADNGVKGSEAGIHLRNMLLKLSAPTKKGEGEMKYLTISLAELTDKIKNVSAETPEMRNKFQQFSAEIAGIAENFDGMIDPSKLGYLEEKFPEYADILEDWAAEISETFSSLEEDGEDRHITIPTLVFDEKGQMRYLQDIFSDINTAFLNEQYTQEDMMQAFSDMFNVRDVASATALINTSEKRWNKVNAAIESATASTEQFYENLEASLGTDKYEDFQYLMDVIGLSAKQVETAWRTSGGTVGMFITNLQTAAGDAHDITEAFEDWDISLAGIQEAMNNTQGAAGQMAKTQLDNLAGDMTLLQSATEGAQIAISDALSPTLRELTQFGSTAVSDLTKAFQEGGIEGTFSELGNVLQLGGQTIFNALSEIITGADWVSIGVNVFGIIIDGVGKAIVDLPKTLDGIVDTINEVMGQMDWLEVGKNLGTSLSKGLVTVVDEGGKLVSRILGIDWLELGGNIVSFVILGITGAVSGIVTGFVDLANNGIDAFLGRENTPKEGKIDWISIGKEAVDDIISGVAEYLQKLVGSFTTAAKNAIAGLTSKEQIDKWLQVGKDLVQGIIDGIMSVANDFVNGAINLAESALQGIKDFLHISSPSKVFRDEVGKMMALGIGVGFEDNMPIDDMVASAQDAVDAVAGVDGPTITPFGNSGGLADVLKNMNMNNQPVTINVYARADQNEKDVANEVQRQLIAWDRQRRAVWA